MDDDWEWKHALVFIAMLVVGAMIASAGVLGGHIVSDILSHKATPLHIAIDLAHGECEVKEAVMAVHYYCTTLI